jgi:predicted nucleic acid-binding protein
LASALKLQLHAGEAEAITLAMDHNAAPALIDEHRARLIAARFGLPTVGCLGILLAAKQHGLISAIAPLVQKLETEAGFWIGQGLKTRVLTSAGE